MDIVSFNSVLHVDVKLVGFDGDGNYGLKVDEADFLRYFETVLEEHEKVCFMLILNRPILFEFVRVAHLNAFSLLFFREKSFDKRVDAFTRKEYVDAHARFA